MRVRFQADADLNQTIVLATVRLQPGIDFQTAIAAGLPGLRDPDVLALATTAGRVLVTHDLKTMPRHFAEFIQRASSAGVILVPQHLPVASVVEELVLVWSVTQASEWTNRIVSLPL